MKTTLSRNLKALAVVGLGLVMAGCSSSRAPAPATPPSLEQVGSTVVKYVSSDLEAALSYRFANGNLGLDWLLVDLAITGVNREAVEIRRDKVALKTPGGDIIPLPRQEELAEAFNSIRAANQRANVAAEPLGYWGGRRPSKLNLVVEPGTDLALTSVWVNDGEIARGRLYFPVPGGVQAGRYELRIDLVESKVRIPFQLGVR